MRFWFFYYLKSDKQRMPRVHDFPVDKKPARAAELNAHIYVGRMIHINNDIEPAALVKLITDFENDFPPRKAVAETKKEIRLMEKKQRERH